MKLFLKLFNIIYIALAAVACVALLTKPLVSIDASLNLHKDTISNLVYPSVEDQVKKEDFDNALSKSLDENGNINIGLHIYVPAATVIYKDATSISNGLTEEMTTAADNLINKLTPTVKELAKLIAKDASKTAIKQSIAAQISSSNPDSDPHAIMQDAGIDDEYIQTLTDDVFDLLLGNEEENIDRVETIDELVLAIDDNISDICTKLADAGVPGYPSDPVELQAKIDSMSDNIEEELKKSFMDANLCDEDGKIADVDAVMDEVLIKFIDKLIGEETEEEPEEKSLIRYTRAESEEEKETELKQKIRKLLTKKIDELNIKNIVEQYWFIPLVITLLLVLPWLLFIIITLFRTLRRNKYWTKSWVIFTFASVQVGLGIVLYVFTTRFMSQVVNLLPLPESPAVDVLKGSSLAVKTSSFIPSILYLVMIPLSIIYIICAFKAKKDYKKSKESK